VYLIYSYFNVLGGEGAKAGAAEWRIWLMHCVTRRKVSCSFPGRVLRNFHFPTFSSPGIHSASDRNGYQAISFGAKRSRRLELTTLPSKLYKMLK